MHTIINELAMKVPVKECDEQTWEELPAVVVPSFLKAGLSFPRLCKLEFARMPSSDDTVMALVSFVLGSMIVVWIGTISSTNLPAAAAAAAFLCDATANLSCAILHTR